MKLIIKTLGTGTLYKSPKELAVRISIVNYSDITNKIIPFFEKNPLFGVKIYDYLDWCKVHKLMNPKEGYHLTIEGLNIIQQIKSGMNKSRDIKNI